VEDTITSTKISRIAIVKEINQRLDKIGVAKTLNHKDWNLAFLKRVLHYRNHIVPVGLVLYREEGALTRLVVLMPVASSRDRDQLFEERDVLFIELRGISRVDRLLKLE
jgi:hypothetical protein